MADFADKLLTLMGSKSQSELARESGVPQTTISGYLRRENRPSWDHVQRLAVALGVDCRAFADDEEAQPTPPPSPPAKPASKGKKGSGK